MKRTFALLSLMLLLVSPVFAQKSKKGFEYSGTKARYSLIGKSKMLSEGVKPLDFQIFWDKKKNVVTVNAGPKEKWYTIAIAKKDTIFGQEVHIGTHSDAKKDKTPENQDKYRCEVKFLIDRVSIKIGEGKLEEYLLEGAKVWGE
ncbi:MAG: hypothetical protein ACK4GL_08710 [Flavobacteriales bacterium]